MAKRLTDNINSQFFEAANKMTSKKARRKIVAYVESYDDVFFWRSVLGKFEDETRYFEILLPTRNNHLDRGKKAAIGNMLKGVHLKVEPEEAKWIRYDVIRSVDRPLMNAEMINKIDLTLVTELDWQLFQLQRKYLDYQVNIGNRIIAVLQSGDPDAAAKAQKLSEPKRMFQNIVDSLFKDTGKTIVRTANEIRFDQIGEQLLPYQLSAGEKQILAILLTVLVEDNQSYVLFMDEPEISLHFEWQKQLIGLVLQLNPNIQIIMTTHSPAVVMDGWTDKVTEVNDITIK